MDIKQVKQIVYAGVQLLEATDFHEENPDSPGGLHSLDYRWDLFKEVLEENENTSASQKEGLPEAGDHSGEAGTVEGDAEDS